MHLLCATYASIRLGNTELCCFFFFTAYSDTSEHRFYFAQCLNATDTVPGFIAIWVYSHKLKNFSKSKKAHQNGNSGVEGS